MKKFTLLAVAVLAIGAVSCKKEYTCACTTTFTITGQGSESVKDDSEAYSKKMSEKTAEAACDNKEESLDNSYKNTFTENGSNNNPGISARTSCDLKD